MVALSSMKASHLALCELMLRAGDEVYSFNATEGELVDGGANRSVDVEAQEVARTFVREDVEVFELTLKHVESEVQDTVRTTAEHPFWAAGRGWIRADELDEGDLVFALHSGWLRVSGGTWTGVYTTVYNFEVEGYHSYFVGASGVWVHNDCSKEARELRKNLEKAGRGPGPDEDAAHIVASGHPRHAEARDLLKKAEIDIKSELNGVGLPKNYGVANPKGKMVHGATHRHKNMDIVTAELRAVPKEKRGDVLRDLAERMSGGSLE